MSHHLLLKVLVLGAAFLRRKWELEVACLHHIAFESLHVGFALLLRAHDVQVVVQLVDRVEVGVVLVLGHTLLQSVIK